MYAERTSKEVWSREGWLGGLEVEVDVGVEVGVEVGVRVEAVCTRDGAGAPAAFSLSPGVVVPSLPPLPSPRRVRGDDAVVTKAERP